MACCKRAAPVPEDGWLELEFGLVRRLCGSGRFQFETVKSALASERYRHSFLADDPLVWPVLPTLDDPPEMGPDGSTGLPVSLSAAHRRLAPALTSLQEKTDQDAHESR